MEERGRLEAKIKPDDSIVTNADRVIETFLRKELTDLLPGSTVWGEEEGYREPGPSGLWLVDPVDGTSNYRFGHNLWGVSIALMQGGELVLGGIALPDLGEVYLAAKGNGATLNGQALPPISPGPILPTELVAYETKFLCRVGEENLPGKARVLGAFVVSGAYVATQRLRGMVGMGESLYDAAAVIVICRELDAEIRFANGDPFEERDWAKPRAIKPAWIICPRDSGFSL